MAHWEARCAALSIRRAGISFRFNSSRPPPKYAACCVLPPSCSMLRAAAFIEPCLPSPADKPPSGSNWIHEIKHDGYRLMARLDPVGIRLITRRGNDWTTHYALVVEAVNHLKVRSCVAMRRAWPPSNCSDTAGKSLRPSSTPSTCWN